jgi:hypothetical protein
MVREMIDWSRIFFPYFIKGLINAFSRIKEVLDQVRDEREKEEDWLNHLERLNPNRKPNALTDNMSKRVLYLSTNMRLMDFRPVLGSQFYQQSVPYIQKQVFCDFSLFIGKQVRKVIRDGVEENFGYLLNFFSKEFTSALCVQMVPRMYPRNYMIQDGTHRKYKGLFLILKGHVNIILMAGQKNEKNKLICKLSEKSYFGDEGIVEMINRTTVDDDLFHGGRNWAYTAKGKFGVVLLFVSSSKLKDLFYQFPVDSMMFLELTEIMLNRYLKKVDFVTK